MAPSHGPREIRPVGRRSGRGEGSLQAGRWLAAIGRGGRCPNDPSRLVDPAQAQGSMARRHGRGSRPGPHSPARTPRPAQRPPGTPPKRVMPGSGRVHHRASRPNIPRNQAMANSTGRSWYLQEESRTKRCDFAPPRPDRRPAGRALIAQSSSTRSCQCGMCVARPRAWTRGSSRTWASGSPWTRKTRRG